MAAVKDQRAAGRRRAARVVWAILATACWLACSGDPPPNLVLVIGDDHGYPYAGFTGSDLVRTPHLDALAGSGTVFRQGYATASVCRPSLMSLLTGLEPLQWQAHLDRLRERGVERREFYEIVDFTTLPQLLGARGYRSFQAGKLWEGTFALAGFSDGTKHDFGRRLTLRTASGGGSLAVGRTTMQPLWDFLDARGGAPFFIWFAPSLPHSPHDAGPEYLAVYDDVELAPSARRYYANITRLDARVGELVDYLETHGLREQTLVVYLSDNGWHQPPDVDYPEPIGGPNGKHSMHELGFRTPVVFSWPGRIPAALERDDLVSLVDVFATLADVAGVSAPPDRSGVSLWPTLRDGRPSPREALFGGMTHVRQPGVTKPREERAWFRRDARWHYLWYEDRETQALFDVSADPEELDDLAPAHPEVAARAREEIERWRERMRRSVETPAAEAPET